MPTKISELALRGEEGKQIKISAPYEVNPGTATEDKCLKIFYKLQSPVKAILYVDIKIIIWFTMKYIFRIWFNSSSAP